LNDRRKTEAGLSWVWEVGDMCHDIVQASPTKCGKNIVVACWANDELGIETAEISPAASSPPQGDTSFPSCGPHDDQKSEHDGDGANYGADRHEQRKATTNSLR
jgi:hypothetical protein